MNLLQKIFTKKSVKFEESIEVHKVGPTPVKVVEVASAGTEIYSGYNYEEYLVDLQGTKAMKVYDKMRRSDPRIKMVLSAVKNPIKSADWAIKTKEESPQAEAQKKLIEHILFKDLGKPWKKTLHEFLSMIDFGHAPFEVTHKVVLRNKDVGPHIGLRSLKLIGQKTVERYNVNSDGSLKSVTQYSYGDTGKTVSVPSEYVVHFSIDKEGDNYEGISMLRTCYGPWLRKNNALKQEAVGNQNASTPIPVLSVPDGEQNTAQYNNAVLFLQNYANNNVAYLIKPDGWTLEMTTNPFDSSKIRESIKSENEEIAFGFLANFLNLGSGSGGSYALSTDQSDFFIGSLEFIADEITETLNNKLIPDLIRLNFPSQDCLVELTVGGIADKAGKEFAESLELLARGRFITPDHELEESLRKKYKLPKPVEKVLPIVPVVPPELPVYSPRTFSEERPKQISSRITSNANHLRNIFNVELKKIADDIIKKLMAKQGAKSETKVYSSIMDIKPSGVSAYNSLLREEFKKIAVSARGNAASKYIFSEKISLNRATAKADLLTMTQLNDLEKAIYLQFGSSVDSTDSDALLEKDLVDAATKQIIALEIGADIVSAQLENETRMDFFDEFASEIDSFTFYNEDPQSEICQALNGATFAINDPELERYTPPLHHNCKSVMIPNLKGGKNNPSVSGLPALGDKEKKSITLKESCQCC